jgi:5-dehydro-2-deoxygluconokinase
VVDCETSGIDCESRSRFASIAAEIVLRQTDSWVAAGIMVGGDNGRDALFAIGSSTDWVVRGIEIAGRKPLSFLKGKPAAVLLRGWPQNQIVKCVVPMVADASSALQNERLRELQYAVEMWGHELMLVLESSLVPTGLQLTHRIQEIQALGICPDWWGIQATAEVSAWITLQAVIEGSNPMCRGVLMLDDGEGEIVSAYRDASRRCPLLHGIIAGKSIYAKPLMEWHAGRFDDAALARNIEAAIDRLIAAWPERE